MKPASVIIYSILLFSFSNIHGQRFGGFPPSFKWKQINTDTARIIFGAGADKQAQRIATLIHKAAADTPFAMGPRMRKINIVLHNQTTIANGYVSLAPFRSEYYLVPTSNIFEFGNLPWYENLAVHEYRHVQQYNNFRNGISRGFYYLFGEQGLALANAIAVPDWYYEGDAVHTETALTTQGRGRLAEFLSGYNSLFVEHKKYSWMKLRNGSLKDYVPDWYQLGYLMVNYGYLQYGNDFWKKVTIDATAFKGLFYPFQRAVKKYSGQDYKTFRGKALDFYRQKLGNALEPEHVRQKTVTSFYFAQQINSDSLLYLKTAYNRLPAFYIKDKEGEHKIVRQNISSENWFSYRNGKIIYCAFSVHPRWSLVDNNDIIVYDIRLHKEKRITHKIKYFTPDLSPSGKYIVAVSVNDSLQTLLNILNSETGMVLRIIRPGTELYITQPRYLDEDHIIMGLRKPDATMSLQLLNISSGNWEELIPYSPHTVGEPFAENNTIYFTANFNANDDIYALQLSDRKIFRLTNGFTGNYMPSVFKGILTWSHFTAEGLVLEQAPVKNTKLEEMNLIQSGERPLIFPVAMEKEFSNIPTRRFATRRYNKTTGLFNFHSWSPDYIAPELTFSLYGENVLNTFSNQLYYKYNQDETSNAAGWNSSYGGLFTVLNGGIEYTVNRTLKTDSASFTLNQFQASGGFDIPLNFSEGKTYKFLDLGMDIVFNHTIPKGDAIKTIKPSYDTYLFNFINWSHFSPQALQYIYPKAGYELFLNQRQLLNRGGYQLLANGLVFLPSAGNHSIVLSGSWQETDTGNIVFANRFPISRGYPGFYFSRMWKISGNYHFPIAYPDWGFGSIIYFRRIRGNLFYDLTEVYSRNKSRTRELRSAGAELFFDTKWWNQLPVGFGLRYSYLIDHDFAGTGQHYFEIILPANLLSGR